MDLGLRTTALIILNKEMEDIMKIAKSMEESGLLVKGISEQLKLNQRNKKEDFAQYY